MVFSDNRTIEVLIKRGKKGSETNDRKGIIQIISSEHDFILYALRHHSRYPRRSIALTTSATDSKSRIPLSSSLPWSSGSAHTCIPSHLIPFNAGDRTAYILLRALKDKDPRLAWFPNTTDHEKSRHILSFRDRQEMMERNKDN